MKNNKKILIAGTGLVIGIIVIISVVFMLNSDYNADKTNNIKIYYLDRVHNVLNYEDIFLDANDFDVINKIFTQIKAMPKTAGLTTPIPSDITLLDYNLNSYILDLNLSQDYNLLSNIDKIFLKSSLVWTYTNNPVLNISGVRILVNGQEILNSFGEKVGILSTENIVINPSISPEKLTISQALIYFGDECLDKLIAENKLLQVRQSQTIEYQIVEKLISGPDSAQHVRTVPANTKIKNIKTEEGICYVDLSSDFLARNTLTVTEEVAIYSIVNSLVELDEINKVQFLIEGKKVDTYGATLDISSPLDKNENIVQQKI